MVQAARRTLDVEFASRKQPDTPIRQQRVFAPQASRGTIMAATALGSVWRVSRGIPMRARMKTCACLFLGTLLLAPGSRALPQAQAPAAPALDSKSFAIPEEAANPRRQLSLYANAHPYMDDSLPELKQQVPELDGLEEPGEPEQGANAGLAAPSDPLPRVMEKLGAAVTNLAQKIPSLAAREEVTQSGWVSSAANNCGHHILCGTSSAVERDQTFRYLILAHQTPQGRLLEEVRTDDKNQPPGKEAMKPNFLGFVESWVVFSPGNVQEARFRYLGRQRIRGNWTSVVAYAQIPGTVRLPGKIADGNESVPMLLQGIVWLDERDGEILQLRTDLLAPQLELRLQRLTSEIRFGPIRIKQLNLTLWLPLRVDVRCEANGMVLQEQHVYSKYHLYQATSRMIVGNISPE